MVFYQIDLEQLSGERKNSFEIPLGKIVRFICSPVLEGGRYQKPLFFLNSSESKHIFSAVKGLCDHFSVYFDVEFLQADFFEIYIINPFSFSFLGNSHNELFQLGREELDELPIVFKVVCIVQPAHLSCTCAITVITKLMGTLSHWPMFFKEFQRQGYTMVHFSPIQPLGDSNSAYSICNQIGFADSLFDKIIIHEKQKTEQLSHVISVMKSKYGLCPIVDIVLNHTATNSKWLLKHPEAVYNLKNSPHLKEAFILDCVLHCFSHDLARGLYLPSGFSGMIATPGSIDTLLDFFRDVILLPLHLVEYRYLDVEAELIRIEKYHDDTTTTTTYNNNNNNVQHPKHAGGDESSFSVEKASKIIKKNYLSNNGTYYRFSYVVNLTPSFFQECWMKVLPSERRLVLEGVNTLQREDFFSDIGCALNNVKRGLYWRLGRGSNEITSTNPLTPNYFTILGEMTPRLCLTSLYEISDWSVLSTMSMCDEDWEGIEIDVVVNHGWTISENPTQDFAASSSLAYFRREIMIWGDCVKLYYGKTSKDNPWLWKYMLEYVLKMAMLFDGFRIDNCHSTPKAFLKHAIEKAREIKPNLIVIAELFTPKGGAAEAEFCAETGINSLIREAIHYHDTITLSHFLHMNSGAIEKPLGSLSLIAYSAQRPPQYQPLDIIYDQTHDNESIVDIHGIGNLLPLVSLVSFCRRPIASTFGVDSLFPRRIDVVAETRAYKPICQENNFDQVRTLFNHFHQQMERDNYSEVYIAHHNDIITITRQHPETHAAKTLMTRFRFASQEQQLPQIIKIPQIVQEILFEGVLEMENNWDDFNANYNADRRKLHGLKGKVFYRTHFPSEKSHFLSCSQPCSNCSTSISFNNFPYGAVIVLANQFPLVIRQHSIQFRSALTHLKDQTQGLSLLDVGVLLYKSDSEERNEIGIGCYVLPGMGPLVYAGFEGWKILFKTQKNIDPDSLLIKNLREGTWALDYLIHRIKCRKNITTSTSTLSLSPYSNSLFSFINYIEMEIFHHIKPLPSYLIPKYFSEFIFEVTRVLCKYSVMCMNVNNHSPLIQSLAMGSLQLYGYEPSAPLTPKSSFSPSLAAGLPFFAEGIMRSWGRDTFVSFRGLFLLTKRYKEASHLLLAYGSAARHGLIPNLLAGGRSPRYNARDATWFWLNALCDYVAIVPLGEQILQEIIPRWFPKNQKMNIVVAHLIQEIIQCHAEGIEFTEENAGPSLDDKMTSEGFRVTICLDKATGLLLGGNVHNCGTWMDKMGSSKKANNYGIPATPRDGAPIEISGLLFKVLSHLLKWNSRGIFPFDSVTLSDQKTLSYKEWHKRIKTHFFSVYYIPLDPQLDGRHIIDQSYVHRRGIFKDVFGSTQGWPDYQFRPNFLLAMCFAPKLFFPYKKEAENALYLADTILRGPLGMKTLDPNDWNYNPYYSNKDFGDYKSAGGFNYHNGPEWIWLYGYFIRAYIKFSPHPCPLTIIKYLRAHHKALEDSPWGGLPELTNKDGEYCPESCPIQAWSMATLLEAAFQVEML